MALLDPHRASSQPAFLADAISRSVYLLVARLSAWNVARRTRASLLSLTTDELDDIGLSRADINDVLRRIR